jgi:hypothetical protein
MDGQMWRTRFQEGHLPSWPCPNCYIGVLEMEEGSLVITGPSVSALSTYALRRALTSASEALFIIETPFRR